uniref:hypothetical protein n=1 Tax=Candidatus Frankia nodulisporulans TaxID=2060052 RepID=UPI0013D11C96
STVPGVPLAVKLTTADAHTAIETAWRDGLSIRDAARVSTRSPAQVQRIYTRLEVARSNTTVTAA